jgi:DNA-binding PadR family transcriptional regulator
LLLEEPGRELYGTQITERTGLKSGSISPILQRLEGMSWLESRWEDQAQAAADGRPPRRYYRLTGLGRREAPTYCHAVATKFSALLHALPASPAFGAPS